MRIMMKPSAAPDREIDLTGTLVSAVAAELWRRFGGNDVVNWMEAERFVESLVEGQAPAGTSAQPPEVRNRHRPVRGRDEARAFRRLVEGDRVTGPLPVL